MSMEVPRVEEKGRGKGESGKETREAADAV
jgi:hypothetical protein